MEFYVCEKKLSKCAAWGGEGRKLKVKAMEKQPSGQAGWELGGCKDVDTGICVNFPSS